MRKPVLIGIIIVLIGIAIYASGAYTYFQERRVTETMPAVDQSADTEAPIVEPVVVKEGQFVNADFFHTGEGIAKIIAYPDGKNILRFENFSVINGPDVYVYLTTTITPTSDINSLGSYIDLGPLKGNIGDQNYELPSGAEGYTTVALWCKRFGVLFPYAVMTTTNTSSN